MNKKCCFAKEHPRVLMEAALHEMPKGFNFEYFCENNDHHAVVVSWNDSGPWRASFFVQKPENIWVKKGLNK